MYNTITAALLVVLGLFLMFFAEPYQNTMIIQQVYEYRHYVGVSCLGAAYYVYSYQPIDEKRGLDIPPSYEMASSESR